MIPSAIEHKISILGIRNEKTGSASGVEAQLIDGASVCDIPFSYPLVDVLEQAQLARYDQREVKNRRINIQRLCSELVIAAEGALN